MIVNGELLQRLLDFSVSRVVVNEDDEFGTLNSGSLNEYPLCSLTLPSFPTQKYDGVLP